MATPQLADVVLAALAAVAALGVLRGYTRGRLAADRAAVLAGDVGLPLDGGALRDRVVERLRGVGIAAWRATALGCGVAAVLALTPLGAERAYLIATIPAVLVVRAAAVARAWARLETAGRDAAGLGAAAPHAAEHLAPWARVVPAVALVGAALAIGLTVGAAGGASPLAAVVLLAAIVGAAVHHAAERRIVDIARAAADPLSLAWGDVLRIRAISTGRSAVAQAAVVAGALALPVDSLFLTAAAACTGIAVVRGVYAPRPLPASLRPRSLAPLTEQDSEPA